MVVSRKRQLLEKCRDPPPTDLFVIKDYVTNLLITALDLRLETTTVERPWECYRANLRPQVGTFAELKLLLESGIPDRDTPRRLCRRGELLLIQQIASSVRSEFLGPKIHIGFGHARIWTTGVTMPEAAVDEDHLPNSDEGEIWSPGYVSAMKAVSMAHTVYEPTYRHLGTGALAPYLRHYLAPAFSSNCIQNGACL